jgi:hypothetical protein
VADCATCGGFGFVNCSWCQGRSEPHTSAWLMAPLLRMLTDRLSPCRTNRRNEAQYSQPVPARARGQRTQVYCLQRGGPPALYYMLNVYQQ